MVHATQEISLHVLDFHVAAQCRSTKLHDTLYSDGRAHLADVVEVSVRGGLLRQELLVGIHHHVQVELLLQQQQPVEAEAANRPHRLDLQHPAPRQHRQIQGL